ncbi:cysteine and tyrosine-rich protein 1-like [Mytilus californianus]|uniref:cysteine and tyrosine-rich protein 1-like n=1 Tax=Mytilus californianus TaxID=6549 RepID=UPI0022486EDF|nr:cysteine and tyrosine-rich protein 1-like [Mytilus californianus]
MIGYVFIFQVLLGFTSASYCSYYSYGYTSYKYCIDGCCYSLTSDPCCYSNYGYIYSSLTLSVGAIVGIVIGVIVAISSVVTIAVCLCCACARSRPAAHGQIITQAQPNISYVATSNQTGMQAGFSQPYGVNDNSGFVPPPAYNQAAMPGQHPS